MLIKKYVAATMNEALAKVKADLGEDAVILQSRKVDRGGLMSLSGKSQVEVTAATPDRHPAPSPSRNQPRPDRQPVREAPRPRNRPETLAPPPALLGIREYAGQSPARMVEKVAAVEDAPRRAPVSPPAADPTPSAARSDDKSMDELRGEIEQLKGSIRDLSVRLIRQQDAVGDGLDPFRQTLRDNGAGQEIIADVLSPLAEQLKPSERDEPEAVEARLHEALANRFQVTTVDVKPNKSGRPMVIAMVGPTGVGKTTTLAKMATNFDVFGRSRVALISTDTYRVAAVEQLRTFAGIAGLPLDVVYRAEELPAAIDRYRDYDVLLVDTAGRSQNDEEALAELSEFMDYAQPDRTLLALSANTRTLDQEETLEKYHRLRYTDLLLTKLDEVSSAGHLLEVAARAPVPWAYLTTGQAVPDDIIAADPYVLAAMVVRREYFLHLREQGFQMSV